MRKFDVIRWWLNCIAGYLVLIVLAMLLGWKYNAWQNYAICTDALQEAAAQYGHPIAAPHPPAFSDVGLFIDVMTDDKYKPVEPPPEIPGGRPSVVIPS